MKLAKRLDDFEAYLGTAMNVILTRMKDEGKDVINLGLGDPDVIPPQAQRQALADACLEEGSHHYPSFYSALPLKKAMSDWYRREFSVDCDAETEVLPLLGSADGLFHVHTALLDPGDLALIPDPCYPAYVASAAVTGAQPVMIPLLSENGFLPDLDAIDPQIARQAKMIWVNYPNNPTAAVASDDFYRKLIDWAREYDVAVISDNPYCKISFDGYHAPSFLQFEGAKEVGVELNSLSKSYNCCGWRVGMIMGNADLISAMNKIKSHSDRGMFYPMQVAATKALNGPMNFMEERNRMFTERRDVVIKGLRKMGIAVENPRATFYIWASLPEGVKVSKDWCFKVLDAIAVWMIPGSMYGEHGEGFFRIALTHPADRLTEAMDRLEKFLG